MHAKLTVVSSNPGPARVYEIELPARLGRSRDASVVLASPMVSRKHCELFESAGFVMARDLGSLNGTFVGSTRITAETAVRPDGLLTIGPFTFRVEYAAPAGAVPGISMEETADFMPAVAQALRAPSAEQAIEETAEKVEAIEEIPFSPETEDAPDPIPSPAEPAAAGADEGFDLSWLMDEPETKPGGSSPAPAPEKPAKAKSATAAKSAAEPAKATAPQPAPPAPEEDGLDSILAGLDDLPMPQEDTTLKLGGTDSAPAADDGLIDFSALEAEEEPAPAGHEQVQANSAAVSAESSVHAGSPAGGEEPDFLDFPLPDPDAHDDAAKGEPQSLSGFLKDL